MKALNKGFLANKGFTLIELMIVVAIIGILAAIIVPHFAGNKGNSNITHTYNGAVQSVCIEGYKWLITSRREPVQVLNTEGKPLTCGDNWQ